MPHLTLEYSSNLKPKRDLHQLFQVFHHVLHQVGGINLENCKSRARVAEQFLIGAGEPDNGFVHLDIRFIEGRSLATKQSIGERIKHELMDCFGVSSGDDTIQITVEIQDIHKATYFKHPEGSLTVIDPV